MRWLDSLSKSTTSMTQCAAATEPSGSATNTRSPESSCACLRPRPPPPPVSRPAPVIQSMTQRLVLSSRRLVHPLLLWDGSTADKVARRATYPTLEHDNYDPGPLAERIRRDKRERSDRSSDDSSSDQDSCGTGSTSEANDIFETLDRRPSRLRFRLLLRLVVDKLPSPNHCVCHISCWLLKISLGTGAHCHTGTNTGTPGKRILI